MKYYKLITRRGYPEDYYVLNKIYKETDRLLCYTVKALAEQWPSDWQQVTKMEYHIHEGDIPDKWCVRVTRENHKEIFKWRNHYDCVIYGYINYPTGLKHDLNSEWRPDIRPGYTEITFNQFNQFILEEDMEKEIIGYKCPQDLYGGSVRKGDLYVKKNSDCNWYYPDKNGDPEVGQKIPKEIVETWEPVYKDSTPEIEINGYKAEFKEWGLDFNNGCATINKKCFIDLYDFFSDKSYTNQNKSITSVTIGRGTFTTDQIKQIVDYYKKL